MDRETTKHIGLIGVGLLGSAMAKRWLQAGFDVVAFDVDEGRLAAIERCGARRAASIQQVARDGRPLVLSLPDSHAVTTVLDLLEANLSAGQIIIDTTTGTPTTTVALAERCASGDVSWLDATVAGSSQQVAQGAAVVLVGGPLPSFNEYRYVFDGWAARVFWLGPSGSGARMKLVVNLAIGLHRAVLAESLALAHTLGFDLQQALEVLKATPAYSQAMDVKGQKMIRGDFAPQARLKQHLKDVELMLDVGRDNGQALPLTALHQEILQAAVDRGDGDLDNSAIIRAWLADATRPADGPSEGDY